MSPSPFVPPPPPKPKIVRLLASAEYFDPHSLEEFERVSGYAVAYDAYDLPEAIADKRREGPYSCCRAARTGARTPYRLGLAGQAR